jgi:hypothetical protein
MPMSTRQRLLLWQMRPYIYWNYAVLLIRGRITFAEIKALRRSAEWKKRTHFNYWDGPLL